MIFPLGRAVKIELDEPSFIPIALST